MRSGNGISVEIDTSVEINLNKSVYTLNEALRIKTELDNKKVILVNGKVFKIRKIELISKSMIYLLLINLNLDEVIGGDDNVIEVTW